MNMKNKNKNKKWLIGILVALFLIVVALIIINRVWIYDTLCVILMFIKGA